MRAVLRGMLAAGGILGVALTASCQTSAGTVVGTVTGTVGTGSAVAGRPYTAHFRITSEQTLANGTTITRETTEINARDSQGRSVISITTPASADRVERTIVRISDPVAQRHLSWISPGKTVTEGPMFPPSSPGQGRVCWSSGPAGSSAGNSASGTAIVSRPATEIPQTDAPPKVVGQVGANTAARRTAHESTRENLGKQTFLGVEATGTRTTWTTPTGEDGNDAPLVRTDEIWRSRELGLTVHSVLDDPRTGKVTRELVEVEQSEPDPAIFQPPAEYEVKVNELHQVPCPQ